MPDLRLKLHRVLQKLHLPVCQGVCGPCFRFGKKQRQNTAYADDSLNWVRMCNKCAEENNAHGDSQLE